MTGARLSRMRREERIMTLRDHEHDGRGVQLLSPVW